MRAMYALIVITSCSSAHTPIDAEATIDAPTSMDAADAIDSFDAPGPVDVSVPDTPLSGPTCGYPPDPAFDRSCTDTTQCSFSDLQVVPCRHAAVGYRSSDAARFNAYRDACYAAMSNYSGRDADSCANAQETLLTDDGQTTYMGTLAHVSVECRAAVCTTVYQTGD